MDSATERIEREGHDEALRGLMVSRHWSPAGHDLGGLLVDRGRAGQRLGGFRASRTNLVAFLPVLVYEASEEVT